MKLRVLSSVCMVCTLIALAGCSKKNNTAETASLTTLTVWHQWSNDNNELRRLYNEAVAEYESLHPNIRIRTETLNTEAYKTKIAAEFAGQAKGIDVFFWWGSGTARKFINAGKLLPLDPYLTDEIRSRMAPGSLNAFEFNGKTYSTPMFSWYMALFCNTELFARANAELPRTWEDMQSAVERLNAAGITPFASGAKDGWNAAFIYQALALREVGAENINRMLSGEIPFEDPGYARAAERLTALYQAGAFGKNPLEEGSDDADSRFTTGRAAMRLMGSWFANTVYTDPSRTINLDSVQALPIPLLREEEGTGDYCGGYVESFWVNAATAHPDEAAEFAIFMNEKVGKGAYETGTGFSGWLGDFDTTGINPLFVQIGELLLQGKQGVLAWDIALDAQAAVIHNEEVQTLFAPNADTAAFISEHRKAINKTQ